MGWVGGDPGLVASLLNDLSPHPHREQVEEGKCLFLVTLHLFREPLLGRA